MEISLETVRRMALYVQGLDGHWSLPEGKEGAAQVIERLGYVQVDTISVIQRAHHHVIWTRFPDYQLPMLHVLQAEDRRIFEWWTHAASFIPMRDYCYYSTEMAEHTMRPWQQKWVMENSAVIEGVLERVRREGALGSADFVAPDGFQQSSWWGWKPAKQALEVLFDRGQLMVAERRQFQRIYDLPERVLPSDVDIRKVDDGAMAYFVTRRAIGRLGIGRARDLIWWRRQTRPEDLEMLSASGELTPVTVEGFGNEQHYALTSVLEKVGANPAPPPQLHFLSPFDNLIVRRSEIERYFGFDYKLEAYFPEAKREYGYFALPILYGTRFIGRVDTKADRKSSTLIVRKLTFEPNFIEYREIMHSFADKLRAFAAFNNCSGVKIENVTPDNQREPLIQAIGDI